MLDTTKAKWKAKSEKTMTKMVKIGISEGLRGMGKLGRPGLVPVGRYTVKITLDRPGSKHPLTGVDVIDQLSHWAERNHKNIEILEADKELGIYRVKGNVPDLMNYLNGSVLDVDGEVVLEEKFTIKKGEFRKMLQEELNGKGDTLSEDGHVDVPSARRKLRTTMEDCADILMALDEHGDSHLPSWWMSKVVLAANYLNSARDYLLHSGEPSGQISEAVMMPMGRLGHFEEEVIDEARYGGPGEMNKHGVFDAGYLSQQIESEIMDYIDNADRFAPSDHLTSEEVDAIIDAHTTAVELAVEPFKPSRRSRFYKESATRELSEISRDGELENIARILRRNRDARINLTGFSDRRGDAGFNQQLSEHRVDAVQALQTRANALIAYLDDVIDYINDGGDSSEYLYGEPDRGAGRRRY